MELNEKIAELIGMHIGDGTLYNTNRGTVWELRGNLNEKDYYLNNVKVLLESIFSNLVFNPKFRSGGKNGCFGIQTSKKEITQFFIEYGFKPGSKTHTVNVPKYIFDSDARIKSAFIRGLFDTDGCLRFRNNNKNRVYTYPQIEFGFASLRLRDDLVELLNQLGYRTYKWGKGLYRMALLGVNNLEKFAIEVAPKNKKHLNKYYFWKKWGYYVPRSHSPAIAVICLDSK